jgi:membrane protein implicated in regulation of membrane protease activity
MKVGCIAAALAFFGARALFALISMSGFSNPFVDHWIELILFSCVAVPCFVCGYRSSKRRELERERARQAEEEREKRRPRTL